MQDEAAVFADPNDRASQESNMALELRNRDRERKLIEKIDETIARTARRSTSCASARSRSKVSGNRSKVSGNSKEALNGRPREGGDPVNTRRSS
jgi:RNA polymerase-binding protein DksA